MSLLVTPALVASAAILGISPAQAAGSTDCTQNVFTVRSGARLAADVCLEQSGSFLRTVSTITNVSAVPADDIFIEVDLYGGKTDEEDRFPLFALAVGQQKQFSTAWSTSPESPATAVGGIFLATVGVFATPSKRYFTSNLRTACFCVLP
ncbi:hypothetical protein [Streptomyces sp. NBC_00233]|uniref:hypothetical protein n=1 Tax=Streptomyces sp. NBC_00233 TaxID=2975686 RepID=UPI002255ECE8|nr:hypothetical protein [Streptomyces sp. NBC_00233]MCX5233124.1 hypothetical protein [Streptomyces sp. NBC_00233]